MAFSSLYQIKGVNQGKVMIGRRRVLKGLLATASASTVASVIDIPNATAGTKPRSQQIYSDLPTPIYDQGMGATDASGFVEHFPLREEGAKQLWVNGVTGSRAHNGLSPFPGYQLNGTGVNYQQGATGRGELNARFGPLQTFADALNSLYPSPDVLVATSRNGEGHQFFFAEGQTFTIVGPRFQLPFYHGIGATYPVCFQSYDPRDPLNVAKHGRAGTGSQGARPVWIAGKGSWPGNGRGDAVEYGGWVFRGLKWLSPHNGQYSLWVFAQSNMLFENMVFDNVELVLENTNPRPGFTIADNNIVRFCAIYGQFDISGRHACGIYSQNTNLTVEDCIFWHCGWRVNVKRDSRIINGGPDIYKHCLYLHNGLGTTSFVHRNVLIDGSAGGLSLRGNHVCHHNVIIDCPTPEIKSGGSSSDTESPEGVSQHSYCQLVIGGADINSHLPRMMGFCSSDGTPDSYHAHCLYINNPGYGNPYNFWLGVQNNVPLQVSHMNFYANRAYGFAPPSKRLQRTTGSTGILSSIEYSDVDNILSEISPMTTSQIYAQIGFPSKTAMIAAMVANPSIPWAYALLDAASTGFDFNFNYIMP